MNKRNSTLVILTVLLCFTGLGQKSDYSSIPLLKLEDQTVIDFIAINEASLIVLKEDKNTKEVYLQRIGANNSPELKLNYSRRSHLYLGEDNTVYLATIDSAFQIVTDGPDFELGNGYTVMEFWTDHAAPFLQRQQALSVLYPTKDEDSLRIEENYLGTEYRSGSFQRARTPSAPRPRTIENTNIPTPTGQTRDSEPAPGSTARAVIESGIVHHSSSVRRHSTIMHGPSRSVASNPTIRFLHPQYVQDTDQLVIIDGEKKNISIHSEDGKLLSSQKINYARPVFWYAGSDQFSYDAEEQEIFISTDSSKGFQYSKLDKSTGEAEIIFKSTTHWDVTKMIKTGSSIFFLQTHNGHEEIHLVKSN